MKLYIFDLDDTLYDKTSLMPEKDLNKVKLLFPFKEAIPLLESLKGIKTIVTNTNGDTNFQKDKIKALKIESYFSDILYVPTDEAKIFAFKILIDKHKAENKNTIIIGNRIDSEIRYGKMLGCKTILVSHGKYINLKPKDNFEIPDLTISNLSEISTIKI